MPQRAARKPGHERRRRVCVDVGREFTARIAHNDRINALFGWDCQRGEVLHPQTLTREHRQAGKGRRTRTFRHSNQGAALHST